MGFICITPALAAAIFNRRGLHGVELTIGNDPETAEAITTLGAHHQACSVGNVVIDADRKVVTTPAYMLENEIELI